MSTDTDATPDLPEAGSPGSLHYALIDALTQWRSKYCGRTQEGDIMTDVAYETEAAAMLSGAIIGVAYENHGLSCVTTAVMGHAADIIDNIFAARDDVAPCHANEVDEFFGTAEPEPEPEEDPLQGAPRRERFN